MSDDANVVPLKPGIVPAPSKEWSRREQEAQTLARLAALPRLDYEQLRLDAAKRLKWRASYLDKIVQDIRIETGRFAHLPPAKDGRTKPGTPIKFVHDDGSEIWGFLILGVHRDDEDRHLLVLADGNATVVNSVPLTDERIEELKRPK